MKDTEARRDIEDLRREIFNLQREQILTIKRESETPILFQDFCDTCQRETTHRSYTNQIQFSSFLATTSQLAPVDTPLKSCLACGKITYRKSV